MTDKRLSNILLEISLVKSYSYAVTFTPNCGAVKLTENISAHHCMQVQISYFKVGGYLLNLFLQKLASRLQICVLTYIQVITWA